MARHRHLKNAPLREALIDIQFEGRVSLDTIDSFVTSVSASYGSKVDVFQAVFGLESDGQTAQTRSTHAAVGRRLQSLDGIYVLQCRTNGFTVSRLSPYGEWEDVRAEAKKLWEQFAAYTGELAINRTAVRYINELKLPLPILDFGTYLTCPPRMPEALPQAISGFLTRVIIPDDAARCVSVVTQALEGPPSGGPADGSVTVLLDIDVFREARTGSGELMWEALDQLREQKNRMFFEHLTEKTVGMYE